MQENSAPQPALQVNQLAVNYGKNPVLWDISFSVPQGSLTAVIGPNGAGKSTLIKAAMGLVTPLSGKVSFFGKPLKEARDHLAYVPQRESVDWDFPITVEELVLMGRYGKLGLFRRPKDADRKAAKRYLAMVGMDPYAHRQISQLSGGQQQRAFLARALLQEAHLYLMDEPFTGVDLATEKMLVKILKELKSEGKTVMVVHHNLHTVESYYDHVVMVNMRLVACGPVRENFNAANIEKTYGRDSGLFGEVSRLAQHKTSGIS